MITNKNLYYEPTDTYGFKERWERLRLKLCRPLWMTTKKLLPENFGVNTKCYND